MGNGNYSITSFNKAHQISIDELYASIQSEYEEIIYGSPVKTIAELAELPDRQYWVVTNESGNVIATIGVVLLANNIAALKSMMVAKAYRGTGLADVLLKHAMSYACQYDCALMLLGTMTQFVAAQKFYLKKGFIEMDKDFLPGDFNPNPVDSLFYKIHL
jgi:GNAT superfamily N-acetyltransferase